MSLSCVVGMHDIIWQQHESANYHKGERNPKISSLKQYGERDFPVNKTTEQLKSATINSNLKSQEVNREDKWSVAIDDNQNTQVSHLNYHLDKICFILLLNWYKLWRVLTFAGIRKWCLIFALFFQISEK